MHIPFLSREEKVIPKEEGIHNLLLRENNQGLFEEGDIVVSVNKVVRGRSLQLR